MGGVDVYPVARNASSGRDRRKRLLEKRIREMKVVHAVYQRGVRPVRDGYAPGARLVEDAVGYPLVEITADRNAERRLNLYACVTRLKLGVKNETGGHRRHCCQ